jgi:hypothetical protein
MVSDVAIVVATFGSNEWRELGDHTARRVEEFQTSKPEVVRVHTDTLFAARNWVLNGTVHNVDWISFLDADDDLDPKFVEAVSLYDGDADVLQTAVRGFQWTPDNDREWLDPVPTLHKQKYPLKSGNYLTIGSPIRAEMFNRVGGFDDWPVLEDWALWLKCYNSGAQFDELYEAVYFINDNHSRNLHPEIDDVARQIRATYK